MRHYGLNDKITIINTNNKNRSISSSTNTYLTKMNSILNVKLHHLNNINIRKKQMK